MLLAILLATPLSWYLMREWLQNFAHRTELSGWMFIGAGLLTLLIALLTVCVQAVKAASANPVKNLRTE